MFYFIIINKRLKLHAKYYDVLTVKYIHRSNVSLNPYQSIVRVYLYSLTSILCVPEPIRFYFLSEACCHVWSAGNGTGENMGDSHGRWSNLLVWTLIHLARCAPQQQCVDPNYIDINAHETGRYCEETFSSMNCSLGVGNVIYMYNVGEGVCGGKTVCTHRFMIRLFNNSR